MIPWFIWSEIIKYATQDNRRLCFVNKSWFKISAGQYLALTHRQLSINRKPYAWFKLAEHLSLTRYDDLNWEFLGECHQVKTVELSMIEDVKEGSEHLRDFFKNWATTQVLHGKNYRSIQYS